MRSHQYHLIQRMFGFYTNEDAINRISGKILYEDKEYENPQEIVDASAKFFSSVYTTSSLYSTIIPSCITILK